MTYKVNYDPVFFKKSINKLSNSILKKGKKSISYKIIYRSLLEIKKNIKLNPFYVVEKALKKITPKKILKTQRLKKKSKKGKASIRQIYYKLPSLKQKIYARRCLISASKKRFGYNMISKLSFELLDAFKGKRNARSIKDENKKLIEDKKVSKSNYRKKVLEKKKVSKLKYRKKVIEKKKVSKSKDPKIN
uniref:ribosomal protein S7 n=1 Tax=Prosopanche bonacinae TaxID=2952648 RepID=UPI002115C8EB|nr:ribosomal protein S7 [Prosopanche bonacinae]USN93695.1 ribosomal protein S7 [Prosopanche bonacinae]